MARGDLSLGELERADAAVAAAEAATGVDFHVALVDAGADDPSSLADDAFVSLGLGRSKACLVMVLADARAVEVRTSAAAAEVLDDALLARAVTEMRIKFLRDAYDEGIEAGMAVLAGDVGASEPAPTTAAP